MASAIYLIGVAQPIIVEENAIEVVNALAAVEPSDQVSFSVRKGAGRKTYTSPQGVANVRDTTPGE